VGAEVGVQRIAKSGATSRWGLEQKQQVVLAKPDVLLIEFAAGDANLRRFVSFSESERNHAEIIKTVHQAKPDAKIYLLALNPTWGLRGVWIRPRLDSYYENTRNWFYRRSPKVG
jgi:acyl-CoA thioesterase I